MDPITDTRDKADTIVAIATPPGFGGVGIVRVSGAMARTIGHHVCGSVPKPRQLRLASFRDGEGALIDRGLVLFFEAPASFTGEDVLELQAHGGPVILNMLQQRALELGARAARPGEFSERAFLNDKLDLAQAEAVADLVSSGTEAAARAAQRSLSGEFSRQVEKLQQQLTHVRVYVEAAIDFPDEEIDFLADGEILRLLDGARTQLDALMQTARQGCLLRDGASLAIIGRPNAGKSSLMNALSGAETAIVTDIPGTTRDILREWIDIAGVPVQLVDTAGLREATDRVEAEGIRRARRAVEQADLVALVLDPGQGLENQLGLLDSLPPGVGVVLVLNKNDLEQDGVKPWSTTLLRALPARLPTAVVSAVSGEGLESLRQLLAATLGAEGTFEGVFSARQRHVDALQRAAEHMRQGRLRLVNELAGELLAEELRLAQRSLGEITGEFLADDLLGAIFSSFCIGK